MTAEQIYLLCFLVGFLFSLLSVLAQGFHLDLPGKHFDLHFPGFHGHGHGHVHVHTHTPVGHAPHGHAPQKSSNSGINAATLMAFITWFGGAGYLLTHYGHLWGAIVFGLSTLSGFVGALFIFWFTAKFLFRHERELDPADFQMVGVLGRVNSGIRAGGTGEIIYSQEGYRRTCGARSEDGEAIPRGVEIVVMRYDRGLAYVRPVDHFSLDTTPHDAPAR